MFTAIQNNKRIKAYKGAENCVCPICEKEDYYGLQFHKKDFYEWAKKSKHPVYFSSVFCEDSFFKEVWSKEKICLMHNKNSSGKKKITERLFWNGVGENYKTTLF